MRNLITLCFLGTLGGCYFFYPPDVPKLPGPVIVEGAQIEVKSEHSTEYTSCGDADLRNDRCVLHKGKLQKPYEVYTAKASYAGHDLTQGEFYMLVVSTYPDKVRAIRAEKGTCNLSLVPSVVGLLGAAFAIVVLASGDAITKDDNTKLALYGAGAGVFGLGALASYPLGGFACRRAGKQGDAINISSSSSLQWWSLDPAEIELVEGLAATFNSGPHQAPSTTPETTPADKPPADKPPAAVPTGTDDVLTTLAKDGRCNEFLKLVAATDLGDKLKSGTFTIFAPTDSTLAKAASASERERWLHDKDKLTKLIGALVVDGVHTSAELTASSRVKLETLSGTTIALKSKDGHLTSDGDEITLPPLTASNGFIYIINK